MQSKTRSRRDELRPNFGLLVDDDREQGVVGRVQDRVWDPVVVVVVSGKTCRWRGRRGLRSLCRPRSLEGVVVVVSEPLEDSRLDQNRCCLEHGSADEDDDDREDAR